MNRKLVGLIMALILLMPALIPGVAAAANTTDVTVNATPAYITISVSPSDYSFGIIEASTTPNTTTDYFTITNGSTVSTNNTISVTTATWSGGVTWTHSDTATAAEDQAGLLANKGGTFGVDDVIVKNSDPNILAASQAATTNWDFGLQLVAPTGFTDGVVKEITVRVTAAYDG